MNKFEELEKYRFAHRGLHRKPYIAENSLSAFRKARLMGYGAELDIHLLADGNLAVIHDSDLKRTTRKSGFVEDLRKEDLKNYKLEQSEDTIPLFEDVLAINLPLIVELKVERNNYQELCEKAWEMLKSYDQPWCMESFDPRAVLWFKRNHPEVCRGQLSQDFVKRGGANMKCFQKLMLTNMWYNILSKPDFIAYNFEDRYNKALHRYLRKGVREVSWTLRSMKDLADAESCGSIPIFETFDPGTK